MLNFHKNVEKTAKTIDEAVELALAELNVTDKNEVNIKILEEGKKGLLGIGSKEAIVKVSIKDIKVALAKQFLGELFGAMDLDINIKAESKDDELIIDLSGENMGLIIGKRGDTLDSIQYLTSLVVNHDVPEYVKVIVDTENYREKREDALVELANRLAAKVTRTGKKYTLEPMNPYERRIIHSTLQNSENVTTFSIGEDPYRKVVISPKNPAPRKPRHQSSENVASYTESYLNYKKTAPKHDTIKKAENFEAYQSAMEAENKIEE